MNEAATDASTAVDGVHTDGDASIIANSLGDTIIRHDVVAKIIGATARDVEGVHRLAPFGAGQSVVSIARHVTGAETKDLGVRVDVQQGLCVIDLRVVARFGASLTQMAEEIRQRVAERVSGLTGLVVDAVNVDVVDLHFPGEDEESPPGEAA